jgi:hypothetical protein
VVEGPDGPLYGWIKLGLEQYFDPDLVSMRAFATIVNATTRESEPFVLRRTLIGLKTPEENLTRLRLSITY